MSVESPKHWDIFCTVIDNYGDIGVTWRLARQLHQEYQISVNLWVDDLASFSHILPELDPQLERQQHKGINILHWQQPLTQTWSPGTVLIEAFACQLPVEVLEHLAKTKPNICWLNLEYLTAEDWVEGCHALASNQLGLKKYFFFPGFTNKTGGLICEKSLISERRHFQKTSLRADYFRQLNIPFDNQSFYICLFSYETQAMGKLIETWQSTEQSIHILLPKGRVLTSVAQALGVDETTILLQKQITIDNLHFHILDMTDQQGFDRLLWSCDFNIVRGEDSFLRAQWAARPFIWHIYPQEEQAHLLKLKAFMDKYCQTLNPNISKAWQQLNMIFNQAEGDDLKTHWQQITDQYSTLVDHAENWAIDAIKDGDLASRLVNFVKNS